MNIHPSFDDFKKLAKRGNLISVFTEVLADSVTPVSLLSSEWDRNPSCLLLESVEGGEKLGRYSIVGFEPQAVVRERNGDTTFATARGDVFMSYNEPAQNVLARYMRCVKPVQVP